MRSHSTRDLNDYDQFFGELQESDHPAERELAQPDRRAEPRDRPRHASACRGKWVFSPLYEWRTGFPWSAVNEFQDFVGERNEAGGCRR